MLNWQSPVSDHWQGKGPDTKLLHDLVEIGRTEGLWRLFGDLLYRVQVLFADVLQLFFQLGSASAMD